MKQGFFCRGEIIIGGHFPVSVISQNRKDVGKLLAPYQDNNMGTCPKGFLTFVEAAAEYEQGKFAREYDNFYDFVADYGHGFDAERGCYGRWENRDAKWDWYVVGGRYSTLIPLKSGNRGRCCLIRELDTGKSDVIRKSELRHWDEEIAPEGKLDASVRERYLRCYRDRDNFADKRSFFITGALVTPEGKWYEIGKNGRIQEETGFSDIENYYEFFRKVLHETDPDYWLTVVDCHM